MTDDKIIEIAYAAGLERVVYVHKDGTRTIEMPRLDLLKRFAALVAAAEPVEEPVATLIAHIDALLEALRKIGKYTGEGPTYSTPWQDIVADLGQTARAAIKAVEGGR